MIKMYTIAFPIENAQEESSQVERFLYPGNCNLSHADSLFSPLSVRASGGDVIKINTTIDGEFGQLGRSLLTMGT